MSAILLAEVEIFDPSVVDEYRTLAAAAISDFGGKYLVRSRIASPVEGDWAGETRIVLLEFSDAETAHAWYNSAAYRKAREIGQRGMIRRIAVVDAEPVAAEAHS